MSSYDENIIVYIYIYIFSHNIYHIYLHTNTIFTWTFGYWIFQSIQEVQKNKQTHQPNRGWDIVYRDFAQGVAGDLDTSPSCQGEGGKNQWFLGRFLSQAKPSFTSHYFGREEDNPNDG